MTVSAGLLAYIAGPVRWMGGAPCLPVVVPEGSPQPEGAVAGRYFLARCADGGTEARSDWGIYLRRALYAVQQRGDEWLLYLPPDGDSGHRWLQRRPEGAQVHLLGPFGNGFAPAEGGRNLLLLADLTDDPGWLALQLGLLEPVLDQGGRVTALLRAAAPLDEETRSQLPIPVEVQTVTDEAAWARALDAAIPWADWVCAGLPPRRYPGLADAIRARRFRLEEGFCQIFVQADILCAVGACLTCVVPTANGGITRACVHGPVLDLTRLVV